MNQYVVRMTVEGSFRFEYDMPEDEIADAMECMDTGDIERDYWQMVSGDKAVWSGSYDMTVYAENEEDARKQAEDRVEDIELGELDYYSSSVKFVQLEQENVKKHDARYSKEME